MAELREVFGINANIDSRSYVDRGGLDQRFQRALKSNRHVVVHGGSKQGKSWLRTKGLRDKEAVVVQCTPTSTVESLLREVLGRLGVTATLHVTKTRELQGTLDFSSSVELGKVLAKMKVSGAGQGSARSSQVEDVEPIGQTAADLSWVTKTILASEKRMVLEDFHYISEDVQRELAFLLKAMGEYGLHVVIVGVWTRDHLLNYYNGDLEGRVEDIHLKWSDDELEQVLLQGAEAMRIRFMQDAINELVGDAFGNVGLLQRLAEQVCEFEGVFETPSWSRSPKNIGSAESLDSARKAVATQMRGRYQTFADNFVRGMRRLPDYSRLEVYRHLLRAATEATDRELLEGIDSAVLLQRINEKRNQKPLRSADLTQALDRIEKLQVRIQVNPLVLIYSKSARKLKLADNAFLFFRRHGDPTWPWQDAAPDFANDLALIDPLDLN